MNVVPVVLMIHRAEREPSAQALYEDLRDVIVISEKGSVVRCFLITISHLASCVLLQHQSRCCHRYPSFPRSVYLWPHLQIQYCSGP